MLSKVLEAGSISNKIWEDAVKNLLIMLAPSAPHLTEELWEQLGYEYSIHNQRWPDWDRALATDNEVTLVVQVNGRVRGRLTVPAGLSEEEARQIAFTDEHIKVQIRDKNVNRFVYVPDKLINIVVK